MVLFLLYEPIGLRRASLSFLILPVTAILVRPVAISFSTGSAFPAATPITLSNTITETQLIRWTIPQPALSFLPLMSTPLVWWILLLPIHYPVSAWTVSTFPSLRLLPYTGHPPSHRKPGPSTWYGNAAVCSSSPVLLVPRCFSLSLLDSFSTSSDMKIKSRVIFKPLPSAFSKSIWCMMFIFVTSLNVE